MDKQAKINRGFFSAILYSFKDLDESISKQIEIRNTERQLLPLLYFTCLILLLSQLIQVTTQVQPAPYLSVITAVIVSYLFFLPIFMYIISFILHLALKLFGANSSSFQTRLAIFWSLAISALIFLFVSVIKVFTDGSTELVVVIFSEFIVVYIFSRVLGFVCNFRDRNLFTFVMISFYLTPVMLINFS